MSLPIPGERGLRSRRSDCCGKSLALGLCRDGLDELLDTSRRRDVSDRVEQFCSAYPLTPVLVTSRIVGYDQARLDDTQFTCYRLGGFGDDEVGEYARNWFATQDGMLPAEAAARAEGFLAESVNAEDLRSNPLLLSLMCILYLGVGSLPSDRAGIYARCAELLLRKWDEQRDLYRKLGSDHLVEPTLRYLAWWLFTREDSQTTATERELIAKSAEFLHERGYETEEEARVAAREFVEFRRGRMWVFSDAGTTADGEKLYGFTHRTFLEYFTASHLAAISDSPEDLARSLAARIVTDGWSSVGELAIKIKDEISDRGVDRVYIALLNHEPTPSSEPLLQFLYIPYLVSMSRSLLHENYPQDTIGFTAIGPYVLDQGKPPWVQIGGQGRHGYIMRDLASEIHLPELDPIGNLGIAVILCIALETQQELRTEIREFNRQSLRGSYAQVLFQYMASRLAETGEKLPDLPIPTEAKQVFKDWAEGQVNFVEI